MRKPGFTLVEVMVGIVLASIVLGAGYGIYSAGRKDFAKATTRQVLQHEVRYALDVMTNDFKAMKAGTLQVTGNPATEATITFERFAPDPVTNKLDSKNTYKVKYTVKGQFLQRNSDSPLQPGMRILSYHVADLGITRGDPTQVTAADVNAAVVDPERARNARLDISLSGEKRVPITNQLASHTEKVSVFIRDEYFKTLARRRLDMTDASTIDGSQFAASAQEDVMLTDGPLDKNALKGLTPEQLDALVQKENQALTMANEQLKQVNDSINNIDGKKDSSFLEPSSWGNFFSSSNEATRLQDKLKKADTADAVRSVQEELGGKPPAVAGVIPTKEKELLTRSLTSGNIDSIMNNSASRKAYTEAFDMKLKDARAQKAWDEGQKDKPEAEKKPYESMLSQMDPSKLTRDTGESDADFKTRVEEARAVTEAAKSIDISWADESTNNRNQVKEYYALKDLLDLSNAKLSYIESRETHKANLDLIAEVKAGK